MGVIIAPGIITSLNSLINQTAQLPEIELKKPKSVLGLDTVTCMQSGMVYGFLGMVEGFVDRINNEVNDDCFVIATGGVSHVYKPLTEKFMLQTGYTPLKGFTTWVKIYKMEVPLKIETERLILSPLKESDITLITEYLQEKIISDNTSNIPYPYSESDART